MIISYGYKEIRTKFIYRGLKILLHMIFFRIFLVVVVFQVSHFQVNSVKRNINNDYKKRPTKKQKQNHQNLRTKQVEKNLNFFNQMNSFVDKNLNLSNQTNKEHMTEGLLLRKLYETAIFTNNTKTIKEMYR